MMICAHADPGMGLCNRLRLFASTIRVARRLGADTSLFWPVSEHVPCRFKDLFECDIPDFPVPVGHAARSGWRLWVADDELPVNWAQAYPAGDVQGRAIDFEFDRIPAPLRQDYQSLLGLFRPRQRFVERASQLMSGDFVAVHIRDGKDWNDFGRGVELKMFLNQLDLYPPSTRFYLSAQQPQTVQTVTARYPGRIVHQANAVHTGQSVQRMEDALVDLLCLASGRELIGTFGSTFTEMAWWLAGCTPPVTIVSGNRRRYRYF